MYFILDFKEKKIRVPTYELCGYIVILRAVARSNSAHSKKNYVSALKLLISRILDSRHLKLSK